MLLHLYGAGVVTKQDIILAKGSLFCLAKYLRPPTSNLRPPTSDLWPLGQCVVKGQAENFSGVTKSHRFRIIQNIY